MAKLNERDRTAIHLADIHELTAEQAARKLAVSKAAFKSTHFRARQRLGRALRRAA
jgi:DNA-directed RNA polymerase specialized sigma24 family protein